MGSSIRTQPRSAVSLATRPWWVIRAVAVAAPWDVWKRWFLNAVCSKVLLPRRPQLLQHAVLHQDRVRARGGPKLKVVQPIGGRDRLQRERGLSRCGGPCQTAKNLSP